MPRSALAGRAPTGRAGGRRPCRGRRRSGSPPRRPAAPNSAATSSASGSRASQSRAPAAKSSAADAWRGVGAAEPIAAPTPRRSGCRARPKEVTAMTIALRVPTLANCCGPAAGGSWMAAISSSGSSALCLTPVKKSATGMLRAPRAADSTSTLAPTASRTGWQSPAGDAEPTLPPTVPPRPDLRRPDRARRHREARCEVAELGHHPGVAHAGAQPHATVVGARPLAQLGHPGEVEQHVGAVPVEVQLDHHVGAAGDGRAARVLGARRERVGPRPRCDELHPSLPSEPAVSARRRALLTET